jgi:heparan-alpha-glucosaminide N-acetyltransferase
MSAPTAAPPALAPARVASVDAYRGLVMFLTLAFVLQFGAVHKAFPDSDFWRVLAHHQEPVTWRGCSLCDLIQPSFSFLVGVALPFSLASRAARGQSARASWLRAFWRAAVLVLLGVFIASLGHGQTNWTFVDPLSQIGLGYVFLFAIGHLRVAWQWVAFVVILIGYWTAFALYPLPAPDHNVRLSEEIRRLYLPRGLPYFDYNVDRMARLPLEERPTGFAAHWDKNTNAAAAFDIWFLNRFPRAEPFSHGMHNHGGYATLSFIPTLATMILGLIAGGWLRAADVLWARVMRLVAVGLALLASGYSLDVTGICPNVHRIWTPTWVLFSGGWCFLFLAVFTALLDTGLRGRWAYPLVVIGANPIVAGALSWLWLPGGFVVESFKTHVGQNVFAQFGGYEPLASGFAVLAVFWLGLWWMYQRKIFVKI